MIAVSVKEKEDKRLANFLQRSHHQMMMMAGGTRRERELNDPQVDIGYFNAVD
jgi:2-C-methyl-D-erythritol 4-phosphate cytidylyltransferase